ncbi:MAG: hypothetical protein J6L03_08270 [Bacteroidaceae bacterium]|nr:hypothetical protein [Bacteroidaceae bacterium]
MKFTSIFFTAHHIAHTTSINTSHLMCYIFSLRHSYSPLFRGLFIAII